MLLQTLKSIIPLLHTVNNYPLYLLNKKSEIIDGPSDFFDLPKNYFKNMIQEVYNPQFKILFKFTETEYYTLIPYQNHEVEYLIIGPILYHIPYEHSEIYDNQFLNSLNISPRSIDTLMKLPHTSDHYFIFLQMFYQLLTDETLNSIEIFDSFRKKRDDVHDSLNFHNLQYLQRELTTNTYPYHLEKKLLHYLSLGEGTRSKTVATEIIGYRILEIENIETFMAYRYTFAQMSSLFRKTAIDSGVDIESAFSLANLYLHKIDQCQNSQKMYDIYMSMITDFSILIKNRRFQNYPAWVRNCMEYIMSHLHETISLQDLSHHVHLQSAYISVQFKKVCGYSIIDFINNKKIEEAKFLLEETTMPIIKISTTLGFSTQNYFTNVFKKYTGSTPIQFRKHSRFL